MKSNHGTTGIDWLNQLVWIVLSKGVERSHATTNQINQCLLNTTMTPVFLQELRTACARFRSSNTCWMLQAQLQSQCTAILHPIKYYDLLAYFHNRKQASPKVNVHMQLDELIFSKIMVGWLSVCPSACRYKLVLPQTKRQNLVVFCTLTGHVTMRVTRYNSNPSGYPHQSSTLNTCRTRTARTLRY